MTAPTMRLLARAAAVATTIGLLAGCTGGARVVDPTPTAAPPSASPSATPTAQAVTAPQWTPEMDEVSVEGAAAVLQYFFALYPYVVVTGDTAEWDRLSHPECVFCADVSTTMRGNPSSEPPPAAALSLVSANELEPGVYFSLELTLDETYDDGTSEASVIHAGVLRDGGSWLIRGIQVDPATSAARE